VRQALEEGNVADDNFIIAARDIGGDDNRIHIARMIGNDDQRAARWDVFNAPRGV
jgi:hypothetical protein